MLDGQLPARILATLDEPQTVWLLGAEPARVIESRPLELRKQIADYLRTRQPAMFDRLYDEPALNDPRIARLQAATPGAGQFGGNPRAARGERRGTDASAERWAGTVAAAGDLP
ncbi:hypothetical protein [Pseudomonas sp. MD195_PC81_125]|uniref:hypothetical protein n=1 Tax=Pseudomonas sp. MD195_PC81_125 TaxID=2741560 RepID=UPI0027410FAE|nr:hypothetical protein [Pseudomonas sp. MD195_PC81_125]